MRGIFTSPDLGHRLFTTVDFVFLRNQKDPLLVRVELTFRDKAAAEYVRAQALERLGAPKTDGDVSWVNPNGGRSSISQRAYVLDASKF